MTKVLVISTIGLGMYGITNSIMNYYRALDKSDLQIDFLSPSKIPVNLREEIIKNGGILYENINRNKNIIGYILQLSKILKNGNYDIVHAHGNSGTLAIEMKVAKMCKVKVRIAHVHNSTCNHKLLNKLLIYIFNNSYTHGFACSQQAGLWLFGQKHFTIINNAIPITKFFYNKKIRDKYRKKLDMENNKVIGHVGHFSYQKNQEFLIYIFADIYRKDPSYRLLFVGDGDLKNKTKNLVKELGLSDVVRFCKETVYIDKLLQAIDIFAFPSRFEGLGMAVIEAQAAGLPCIVSDAVPSEAKIIDNVIFLKLTDQKNVWINKIMEFGQLDREECFEHNRELVQNSIYNIENEAMKLKNLYVSFALEK